MKDLGKFKKANAETLPEDVMAWIAVVGIVMVAIFSTVAWVNINEAARVQAMEDRV